MNLNQLYVLITFKLAKYFWISKPLQSVSKLSIKGRQLNRFCVIIRRGVHFSHHFLVKSPTKSPISNHPFFCFKSPKCALKVAINISNPLLWMKFTAHFGDLKQKNCRFEIGDLVGVFTKSLLNRRDGAPKHESFWNLTLMLKSNERNLVKIFSPVIFWRD